MRNLLTNKVNGRAFHDLNLGKKTKVVVKLSRIFEPRWFSRCLMRRIRIVKAGARMGVLLPGGPLSTKFMGICPRGLRLWARIHFATFKNPSNFAIMFSQPVTPLNSS